MLTNTWKTVRKASLSTTTILLLTSAAVADVLDVDGGEFSTVKRGTSYVVNGVLDLDRPPEIQKAPENASPSHETKPSGQVTEAAARFSAGSERRGSPEIEALVMDVALKHARHPGIRAAGLSTTEWVALFRANIAIESNFDTAARSRVGAIGLGQLMPATAEALGVNPHNPRENLEGSARYLLTQLKDFGSKELALAAYNAGPEAVSRYEGIPPYRETQGHVRKVLAIFNSTLRQEKT